MTNTELGAAHPFDVSGLETGAEFLGCIPCAWRLDPGQVCAPVCPSCGERLSVFTVTKRRLEKGEPLFPGKVRRAGARAQGGGFVIDLYEFEAPHLGNGGIGLCARATQEIFDDLWSAGLRPSKGES